MKKILSNPYIITILLGSYTAIMSFVLYLSFTYIPMPYILRWPINLLIAALLAVIVAYSITEFFRRWRASHRKRILIAVVTLVVVAILSACVAYALFTQGYTRAAQYLESRE